MFRCYTPRHHIELPAAEPSARDRAPGVAVASGGVGDSKADSRMGSIVSACSSKGSDQQPFESTCRGWRPQRSCRKSTNRCLTAREYLPGTRDNSTSCRPNLHH